MTENEMLAGDLLTACTLLAAEKELADEAVALLVEARFGGHPKDLIALEDRRDAVMARYREARQR